MSYPYPAETCVQCSDYASDTCGWCGAELCEKAWCKEVHTCYTADDAHDQKMEQNAIEAWYGI